MKLIHSNDSKLINQEQTNMKINQQINNLNKQIPSKSNANNMDKIDQHFLQNNPRFNHVNPSGKLFTLPVSNPKPAGGCSGS